MDLPPTQLPSISPLSIEYFSNIKDISGKVLLQSFRGVILKKFPQFFDEKHDDYSILSDLDVIYESEKDDIVEEIETVEEYDDEELHVEEEHLTHRNTVNSLSLPQVIDSSNLLSSFVSSSTSSTSSSTSPLSSPPPISQFKFNKDKLTKKMTSKLSESDPLTPIWFILQ